MTDASFNLEMGYDFWTISNKKGPFCTTCSITNKENLTQNWELNQQFMRTKMAVVCTASSRTNKENQEFMSLPEFNGCMGRRVSLQFI